MKTNKTISIVLADDHAIVRDGMRMLFNSDSGFVVVGEASDGVQALELTTRLKPDIVILDISMPKLNGIEATRIIREKMPETMILILTIHEGEEFISQVIQAGANGYVLKNAEKKEILDAVRAVVAGGPFIRPRHLSRAD